MDKITKLSQAIRLGSTFRPQAFGGLYVAGGSCALGAAAEALHIKCGSLSSKAAKAIIKRFPKVPFTTLQLVIQLNDRMRLSREQIADWLENQGL